MTTELPAEPKSRKEQYLADIAGQTVALPDAPASREEQYLAYIAENGGGGGGGTSNFNQLTNRPKYNGTTMTGDTNIPRVISYSNFTGTDGTSAGAAGLVPAPATTDAGKFLKADGTWATASGSSAVKELTSADYNWPVDNPTSIAIWLLEEGQYVLKNNYTDITFYSGNTTHTRNVGFVVIEKATANNRGAYIYTLGGNKSSTYFVGSIDVNGNNYSSDLLITSVINNLTSSSTTGALSAYQGKVLKDSAIGTTETFTVATSDWSALASSAPYTYSTTVTLTTTLSVDSEVELINDQLVAFANYGFGILSISGQVATIASIGQPSASITFKIKVRG